MSSNDSSKASSLDDVLPAQLGIVLVRRPTLGHAAATLVSMAGRGMVTATCPTPNETAGGDGDGDWLLARTRRPPAPRTRFEAALLDGLPPAAEPLPLTEATAEDLAPALRKFAGELVKDAVHRGWLRHLHHDQLTSRGEEFATRARGLRTELRRARANGQQEVLASKLPCALVFGLVSPDSTLAAAQPLARFAAAFVSDCSALPDWQRPDPKHEFPDIDTWSRNEWGGMPPGGQYTGSY